MTNPPGNQGKSAQKPQGNWLKNNFLSLLIFTVVVAITVSLFFFQDKLAQLKNWGYLGAFVISVTANATVVLPMPSLVILLPMGAAFNPVFIGLAAGLGGTIGEMTAYLAGYSGRGIWHDNKAYLRAVTWLKKWGMPVVFLFAVTPLPIDVMGLAAGNLRFPARKYFVACLPGKIIKYIILAFTGQQFYGLFINSSEFRTGLLATGLAIVAVVALLTLALFLEHLTWQRRLR